MPMETPNSWLIKIMSALDLTLDFQFSPLQVQFTIYMSKRIFRVLSKVYM
jgi:hypothetical protein